MQSLKAVSGFTFDELVFGNRGYHLYIKLEMNKKIIFTVVILLSILLSCGYEIQKVKKPRSHHSYFEWDKDRKRKRVKNTYKFRKKPDFRDAKKEDENLSDSIPSSTTQYH